MISGLEDENSWTKKINYKNKENKEIGLKGKNTRNGCSSATQFHGSSCQPLFDCFLI